MSERKRTSSHVDSSAMLTPVMSEKIAKNQKQLCAYERAPCPANQMKHDCYQRHVYHIRYPEFLIDDYPAGDYRHSQHLHGIGMDKCERKPRPRIPYHAVYGPDIFHSADNPCSQQENEQEHDVAVHLFLVYLNRTD